MSEQTTMGVGELDRSRSQFFTHPDLALKVARWAWRIEYAQRTPRVLEPSAGRGALIRPVLDSGQSVEIQAFEIDPVNAEAIWAACADTLSVERRLFVRCADFLEAHRSGQTQALGRFDLSLLNTPFENDQDIDFARACCELSARAVGIFPARMLHSQGRAEFWRWHDVRREAVLSKRPRFGGPMQGMTDFLVLDIAKRERARLQGEATPMQREWW